MLCYTIFYYYIMLCYIMLYYVKLYYIILYYVMLYYILLYYTILYYVMLCYIICTHDIYIFIYLIYLILYLHTYIYIHTLYYTIRHAPTVPSLPFGIQQIHGTCLQLWLISPPRRHKFMVFTKQRLQRFSGGLVNGTDFLRQLQITCFEAARSRAIALPSN